jgi:CBS domain containing-hemolysin-like protein
MMTEPEPLISAAVAGTALGALATAALTASILAAPLTALWSTLLGGWSLATAVALSVFIVASAAVVAAQLVAKSLLHEPLSRVVVALAVPLKLVTWGLTPFTYLATRAAGSGALSREFDLALRDIDGPSDLDEEEQEMLENVIELRTLRVHDSMVPRTDIRAVVEGADLESVRRMFVESGHSRLPVYRESLDRIVGVVLAHDLFHDPDSLAAITREVPFVPEARPARDLLFELLRGGVTMAVVLDEFGGTAGIVTVEDLLEELFGDIRDEHDAAEAMLRRIDDNTFLAAGRATLEEVQDEFGLVIPEGEYDTVGGYLLDRVGTIPEARQTFEFDGLRLTVLDATANRIGTVRIERLD